MNKTLLITGATDGIGKELSYIAAQENYTVILHGRNSQKLENLKKELQSEFKDTEFRSILADFSDLEQTSTAFKKYVNEFETPDVIINNAALLNNERKLTKDGFEEVFQVNHLAGFLVTQILMDKKKADTQYRIINVTSMIHALELDFDNINSEKSFSPEQVYEMTKLCNVLYAHTLTRKYNTDELLSASVHPGVIDTKLLAKKWSGGLSPKEGAYNVFFVVEFPGLVAIPGSYIENRRPMRAAEISYSEEVQDKLWEYSTEVLKKYL